MAGLPHADARAAGTPRAADAAPVILIAESIERECAAWLGERASVVVANQGTPAFDATLARAHGLIVRTSVRVDGALLAGAPQLRVVGRAGVGLDNVDLPACAARGVRVLSTPGANTQAVVEFVLAGMLDRFRPRASIDRAMSREEWEARRIAALAERQLSELTVGILGLGRIGSALARVCSGIGMRVLYHDIDQIPPERRHGASSVSLRDMLASADVLSVHVDGRPENRGLIDAAFLSGLRPAVFLINTSRGLVVDVHALGAWLRAHPGARALVDVHEPEPIAGAYPLLGLENATLTPHIAAATHAAKRAMSWVVKDVWEALVTTGSNERP